jgi:hypothetical protein
MRRKLALTYANRIARRLCRLGGIVSTPEAFPGDAFVVTAAWVFGSTAKGSQHPNDLDILLLGRVYRPEGKRRENAKMARAGMSCRYILKRDCRDEALRSLKAGMRMVRFHDAAWDGPLGDIWQTKIMIYPRMDLKA